MIRIPADGPVRATTASRVPRYQPRDVRAVWPTVRALEPAALLIDVEPLVAAWGTGDSALLRGLREQLDECSAIASLREVFFVTNSRRSPSEAIPSMAFPVSYISHARKPFLEISRFSSLRPPVVVVGDQVLTDGLMAWRLNATFVQVPLPAGSSFAVRAQGSLGRVVASLFLRRLARATSVAGAGDR
jgi:predicted HAD superfamily phosphohydrolase YqeG